MTPDPKNLENEPGDSTAGKSQSSIYVLGCFIFLILSTCLLVVGGGFLALTFRGERQRLAEHDTILIQKKQLAEEARIAQERQKQQDQALIEKIKRDQVRLAKLEKERKAVEAKLLAKKKKEAAEALKKAARDAQASETEAKKKARDEARRKELAIREQSQRAIEAQQCLLKTAQANAKLKALPRLGVSPGQQAAIAKRVQALLGQYANKKASLEQLKRVLAILNEIVATQSLSADGYKKLDEELERSS